MYRILILCSLPAAFGVIVRDPPPSATDYRYSYDIEDPYTGDSKSQHEVRQGDIVSGAYSVVGPDGTKRTVEYTADSKHGFQAVIHEEPLEETTPMKSKIPYVSKSRFYTKPVYTLEGAKLPIQYSKYSGNVVYFTPENEIEDVKIPLEEGKYFEPSHE